MARHDNGPLFSKLDGPARQYVRDEKDDERQALHISPNGWVGSSSSADHAGLRKRGKAGYGVREWESSTANPSRVGWQERQGHKATEQMEIGTGKQAEQSSIAAAVSIVAREHIGDDGSVVGRKREIEWW